MKKKSKYIYIIILLFSLFVCFHSYSLIKEKNDKKEFLSTRLVSSFYLTYSELYDIINGDMDYKNVPQKVIQSIEETKVLADTTYHLDIFKNEEKRVLYSIYDTLIKLNKFMNDIGSKEFPFSLSTCNNVIITNNKDIKVELKEYSNTLNVINNIERNDFKTNFNEIMENWEIDNISRCDLRTNVNR